MFSVKLKKSFPLISANSAVSLTFCRWIICCTCLYYVSWPDLTWPNKLQMDSRLPKYHAIFLIMQRSKSCSHFRSYNTARLSWHLLLWFRDLSCKIYIFMKSNRSAMHHYNKLVVEHVEFLFKNFKMIWLLPKLSIYIFLKNCIEIDTKLAYFSLLFLLFIYYDYMIFSVTLIKMSDITFSIFGKSILLSSFIKQL